MDPRTPGTRALRFHYSGLEIDDSTLRAHFDLDDHHFTEVVTIEGVGTLDRPDVRAIAHLWYLAAGLSYYKAGAARSIDLGATPISESGFALLRAALIDGLGEYSFRNNLPLDDVEIVGGSAAKPSPSSVSRDRVLTPFGGGIDSVVTVTSIDQHVDQALFVMSPPSGRFDPLEATAALTRSPIRRATRELDPMIARGFGTFNGHVPVTLMITLLAVLTALADDRGAVAMSNEHSASVANLVWNDRSINHQWSKSWEAEQLIADAVAGAIGSEFAVSSFLRDRSELWVAREFASLKEFHGTFRSCNRAFTQDRSRRAVNWCGECDKCLFIHLVLAPFMDRATLAGVLGVEPLADPARFEQLRTLVGLGEQRKPFECVGDPTECAVALRAISQTDAWRHVDNVARLASMLSPDETLDDLLMPQGVSRVPAEWLR